MNGSLPKKVFDNKTQKLSMIDKNLYEEGKKEDLNAESKEFSTKITEGKRKYTKSDNPEKIARKSRQKKAEDENFDTEEPVKLISKKTHEKNSMPENIEIDLTNNIFKDCKCIKGQLSSDYPCKIVGCRKRNNIIQFVVLFKGSKLTFPNVVSYDDLIQLYPELVASYLIESI